MNVVGTRDREKILLSLQRSEEKISTPKITTNRARPFVRIQDGCENYCSYCIVPYTRGKLQSVPEKDVVEAIRRISDQGYYEVVLTGIHIGAYGKEPGGKGTLPGLLQKLLLETGISRIRLSSIDPDEIDDTFIRLIAESNGRIAPHLHIPLQSGCDTTLKRMKRKYSTKLYLETVNALRKSLPDIAIGADVITGFIGENDEEFKTTYNFIKDLPVTYLHVFTYSDRKGTEAFLLPEKVDEAVKKERAKRLRELSTDKRIRYLKSNIGKAVTVVFDKKKTNGYWKGVSENYITVLVEQIDNKASHHQVRLQKVAGETIIGSIYEVNI
jgi:threonylcarbamoyladenosine tRNA methylthiotransferase MtaB